MIKIVFFDIDGTLLPFGKTSLSKKTIYALNKLRENGIKIVIATGRSPLSLPKFEGVTFDAYVTFNGSYCYCNGIDIYANKLDNSDVKHIYNNANKLNLAVSIATKDNILSNGKDQNLIEYFKFANLEINVVEEFDKYLDSEIFQVMVGCTKDEYDILMQDVENAKIAAWWSKAVDIIPLTGGKGKGIRYMLDYLGLSSDDALCFGDGHNDLEMFAACKYSVAMGNACDEVKEHASTTCMSCFDDGIYYYLLDIGLIEEAA